MVSVTMSNAKRAYGMIQLREDIRVINLWLYTYADSIAFRVECSLAQADRQGENGEHASGGCKDTRVQHKGSQVQALF